MFVFFSEVEEDFMPWLMKQVKKEVGTVIESREILKGKICCYARRERASNYSEIVPKQFYELLYISCMSKIVLYHIFSRILNTNVLSQIIEKKLNMNSNKK